MVSSISNPTSSTFFILISVLGPQRNIIASKGLTFCFLLLMLASQNEKYDPYTTINEILKLLNWV